MASRYAAARPKRAGEAFARVHHGEGGEGDSSANKVKFDVRNPSALAPDAREDDDVLDADVIGGGSGTTKRGAVNIDGYDSDSDNETFDARAQSRTSAAKGKHTSEAEVDLADQLDNYDARLKGDGAATDDEDDDMFGGDDDDENEGKAANSVAASAKRRKEVRFLETRDIEGQEQASKSGGHVRLDDESTTDEEDAELEIEEEGLDEEVGAGGLKKHAPKIDAFNMREEQEEGAFDESGNFVRKAQDPDAVHDRWLEGVSKKSMKKAAEAQEKRQEELKQQRKEDDSLLTSDLIAALLKQLDRGETSLEALARLGKKVPKKVPKWKQKTLKRKGGAMDLDNDKAPEDEEQTKAMDAINAITEVADRLLKRDYPDIYDTEREMLLREYRSETGEAWVDSPPSTAAEATSSRKTQMWEYRWIDGRDGAALQGPFDGPTMKAWKQAGYFDGGIEFRPAGEEDGWTRVATFI